MELLKWDYIKLISESGTHRGSDGGVYDLLLWCDKRSTAEVTEEEAREYYELFVKPSPPAGIPRG